MKIYYLIMDFTSITQLLINESLPMSSVVHYPRFFPVAMSFLKINFYIYLM